jgi:hypothetical protein
VVFVAIIGIFTFALRWLHRIAQIRTPARFLSGRQMEARI